jgi:hypothetical protein
VLDHEHVLEGDLHLVSLLFILVEIKLCLARLIHEYRILPPSNEKYELNRREGIVIVPEQVLIKLEKR